ncbi:hypothetical protein [Allocoleopsis sp.]|uniref:hypothetical protein n=1 Tax=Allocoleopsis sp. TaxID=3088169 RepID=UPI002FCEE92E
MQRKKFFLRTLIKTITLVSVVFLTITTVDYYFSGNYEMYPVAVFDLGQKRSVFVLTEIIPTAPVQSYYYRVRIASQIIVQNSHINYGSIWIKRPDLIHGRPTFTLVTANKNDLVALVEKSEPRIVLALHDFTSGESWPRSGNSQKAKLLLKKLAEFNPGSEYVLAE